MIMLPAPTAKSFAPLDLADWVAAAPLEVELLLLLLSAVLTAASAELVVEAGAEAAAEAGELAWAVAEVEGAAEV